MSNDVLLDQNDTEIGIIGPYAGTEGSDEGALELESNQRKAIMEQRDTSLFEYHRWKQQGRINLNPDWQRDYVWRGKRPSYLIESIFMKIPIPVLFLAKTQDGNYEVIDGVQRLTTIYSFFEDKFQLSGLEVYPELNGLKFSELSRAQQSQLEDSVITNFQLSEHTPQDLLFATFERINTGGVQLNEMEIRNCIYRGTLNAKLRELAENKDFIQCVNMRNISDRMFDRSLVLRFLAFGELRFDKASSGLKSFLNRFFENYRNPSEAMLTAFDRRFKRAMKNCLSVFGNHAFRLRRIDSKGGGEWAPRVNATIFQVLSTSLSQYDSAQIATRSDAIFEEYLDILNDQRWIDAISKATGDAANIKYAFETWYTRLDRLMESTEGLDKRRIFTKQLKEELFSQSKKCSICGNEIRLLNDAAVDHVDQYWRGGKTIPNNARLVHRSCNSARTRAE